MTFSETPRAIKATAVADAATIESVLSIAVIILMSAIENIKATKTEMMNQHGSSHFVIGQLITKI